MRIPKLFILFTAVSIVMGHGKTGFFGDQSAELGDGVIQRTRGVHK